VLRGLYQDDGGQPQRGQGAGGGRGLRSRGGRGGRRRRRRRAPRRRPRRPPLFFSPPLPLSCTPTPLVSVYILFPGRARSPDLVPRPLPAPCQTTPFCSLESGIARAQKKGRQKEARRGDEAVANKPEGHLLLSLSLSLPPSEHTPRQNTPLGSFPSPHKYLAPIRMLVTTNEDRSRGEGGGGLPGGAGARAPDGRDTRPRKEKGWMVHSRRARNLLRKQLFHVQ
jgi:hypothetical protein